MRKTVSHPLIGVVGVGLVSLLLSGPRPDAALARSSGVVGYSGKQSPQQTCNMSFCHGGGALPVTRFEGPDRVFVGATSQYRFVVVSRDPSLQVAAGFNVAAGAGVLGVVEGEGAREDEGELTHLSPKENEADGSAGWDFTWKAPEVPGEYVLFGAGNSVDLSFGPDGDMASTARLVVVVDAEPTPIPTVTPIPGPCTGDCNEDARVGVDELVNLVNIALGSAPVASCPLADTDDDPGVAIDEVTRAVGYALGGCP